jgi:hypothetical protein
MISVIWEGSEVAFAAVRSQFDTNRTRQHEYSCSDTLIQYGSKYLGHSRGPG